MPSERPAMCPDEKAPEKTRKARRASQFRTRKGSQGRPPARTPDVIRGRSESPDGLEHQEKDGGAEGNRTPDLVIANDALSQLSYGPDP